MRKSCVWLFLYELTNEKSIFFIHPPFSKPIFSRRTKKKWRNTFMGKNASQNSVSHSLAGDFVYIYTDIAKGATPLNTNTNTNTIANRSIHLIFFWKWIDLISFQWKINGIRSVNKKQFIRSEKRKSHQLATILWEAQSRKSVSNIFFIKTAVKWTNSSSVFDSSCINGSTWCDEVVFWSKGKKKNLFQRDKTKSLSNSSTNV